MNQKLGIHEVGLNNQEDCGKMVWKRFEYGIEQAGCLRGREMVLLVVMVNFEELALFCEIVFSNCTFCLYCEGL